MHGNNVVVGLWPNVCVLFQSRDLCFPAKIAALMRLQHTLMTILHLKYYLMDRSMIC